MAKSPQNRFGSAAEFSSALDAAPLETSRTKRRLAIGVAALLLAGLVALPFIKLPFGSAGQTPPTTEAVAIHGFQAPFTLLESGYHKPPAETERIPPFSEQSRFCWFVYRDANGDEFNFSFDSFYESPSCGEFVFGAKGADLPGAVHLIPGSAEDEILWNLLNTEKSEAELKRLEEIQWDEPSLDKQTRDAKTFEGQIYELRARRSSRLDLGTWPIR